jgi:hypothetical protein
MSSVTYISGVVNRFVKSGSVNKGKLTGKLPVSEEVVEDLRKLLAHNPQTFLTRLSHCTHSSCNIGFHPSCISIAFSRSDATGFHNIWMFERAST